MNSGDWCAGYDLRSVKLAFSRTCGYATTAEAEAKGIFEDARMLTNDELDDKLTDTMTFRDRLDQLIQRGVSFPCSFASIVRPEFWLDVDVQLKAA